MNPIRNPIKNKYDCTNKVDLTIPTKYDYKFVKVKCGTTSPNDGETLVCDECLEEWNKKNPNGLYHMYGGDDDYDDGMN